MGDDGFAELANLKKRLESLGVKIKSGISNAEPDGLAVRSCQHLCLWQPFGCSQRTPQAAARHGSLETKIWNVQMSGRIKKEDVNRLLARCTHVEAALNTVADQENDSSKAQLPRSATATPTIASSCQMQFTTCASVW